MRMEGRPLGVFVADMVYFYGEGVLQKRMKNKKNITTWKTTIPYPVTVSDYWL